MTSKERVLERERQRGRVAAQEVQSKADSMTGTELYAVDDRIPRFAEACKKQNMLTRPIGFVCKSSAGRVVKLLQPYDSSVFTQEPEELPAQWGFKWSTDPAKAQPFVAISTSPYNKGECCTENNHTYRSVADGNVWAPSVHPSGWEAVM
jgi:hypothetical protein